MTVRRSAIRSKRSKERQGHRFKTMVIFIIIVIVFMIGGTSWLAQNENILISDIRIEGARSVDAEDIMKQAEKNISGNYLWIFPKKNIFIFSKKQLKVEILDKYKQIKNVVVERDGFRAITITIFEREPFALWCDGEAPVEGENADVGNCYLVDQEGCIYVDASYFHDHIYFELYGKPFIEEDEFAEKSEEDENLDRKEILKDSKEEKAIETMNDGEDARAEDITDKREYIGKYFLPPAEFARTMQFISSLEKIEISAYSLIIDLPDMYKLTLVSGGVLNFLPAQDYQRAINDLTTAYKKKFSESPDLLPEDLEYIDIRFNNKILFKFKDQN